MSMYPADSQSPLPPVYPFNEPGQPVRLYEGPVGGLSTADVQGAVELSCARAPSIEWIVDISSGVGPKLMNASEVTLLLRTRRGDLQLPGVPRETDGGWSNGATHGRANAPLKRLVAHWFNLPNLHGPIKLTSTTEGGGRHWWLGRWTIEVHGWLITLDVRPDHGRIWRDLHKTHVYVMTHLMEVRRTDGTFFTASEAEPLLEALHVGVSFALGCWVAPMLPVGEDADGTAVWEEWRVYHCDPARVVGPGWWYPLEYSSLADLLAHVVKAFADPGRRGPLRMQMILAIEATSDRGFVERRVMAAAAGLEHLMWQTLVRGGHMSETQYRSRQAHELLRMTLQRAQIPTGIDTSLLPVAAQFVAQERQRQGGALDGPDVVTQIRNRLVHPKDAQDQVYALHGLVAEVWLLARHYLVLLILHQLGYRGSYRDLRKTSGWAGDVTTVPWT